MGPFLFLNTCIHPSLKSSLNLSLSQLIRLSNSSNLALSKYRSDLRNRSISRSACVKPYFDLIKYRITRQYFR